MSEQNFCAVCGEPTEKPIASALSHFKLYQRGYWRYMRGNVLAFGLWDGLWATVYLASPLVNTLRHWKNRKSRLYFPPGVTKDIEQ